MKFKVGDSVQITAGNDPNAPKPYAIGEIGRIDLIDEEIRIPYCVRFINGVNCWYSEDMLELVEAKENTASGSSPIKDSGDRTTFSTGAVRDMQGEDKGRCDLLPLDVVSQFTSDKEVKKIFWHIDGFLKTGKTEFLIEAARCFYKYRGWTLAECMLEVSIHYRDGAEKYKPNNWKLGIPMSSYISSGVRHLLKFLDNKQDERHDRAFVWNMFGAIYTMDHKRGTDLVDIVFSETGVEEHDNGR